MTIERYTCRVGEEDQGRRLDVFLATALPAQLGEVSRRQVRRWIDAGAVYLDGRRVRIASVALRPEALVELVLEERRSVPTLEVRHILYEDDDLIAVDKPSGVATQATPGNAVDDALAQLRRLLASRDGRPPQLALHHRLDRGTSGVLLFARRPGVNQGLATAFAARRVRKVYEALTAIAGGAVPTSPWTVSNRLSPPRLIDGRHRVVAVATGGREAETELVVRELWPRGARIEARPRTGRTHQIRVHLADCGLPVLGDEVYGRGAEAPAAPRLMLHARLLELEHPTTGALLTIESPLPQDFQAQILLLAAPPPGGGEVSG